jgi:hypothetical protein
MHIAGTRAARGRAFCLLRLLGWACWAGIERDREIESDRVESGPPWLALALARPWPVPLPGAGERDKNL